MSTANTLEQKIIHFDSQGYERAITLATATAGTVIKAYRHTVDLSLKHGKKPPAILTFLGNPKMTMDIHMTDGSSLVGDGVPNEKILELKGISLNYLNGVQGLMKKEAYQALTEIEGSIEFTPGYLEVELKNRNTHFCETPTEIALLEHLKGFQKTQNDFEEFTGDTINPGHAGFGYLTENILYWNAAFQTLQIDVLKLRKVAAEIDKIKKS